MPRPKSETQAAFRAEVAAWLGDLQKRTGLGIDAIALRAGVGKTTLYRWLKADGSEAPSHTVLASLAETFGVPLPSYSGASKARVAQEPGLVQIEQPAGSPILQGAQSWWQIGDRALELAGYLVGDMVLLDEDEAPRRGDAVVVETFDPEAREEETILRIFAPPALVTRSADPSFVDRADFIGQRGVRIRGPIVRMIRDRST